MQRDIATSWPCLHFAFQCQAASTVHDGQPGVDTALNSWCDNALWILKACQNGKLHEEQPELQSHENHLSKVKAIVQRSNQQF